MLKNLPRVIIGDLLILDLAGMVLKHTRCAHKKLDITLYCVYNTQISN